ncbi:NAD(P)-binding protein [Rhizodiscina lignyota]|uniref:Probable quinone oxidoreductase n=1 Tax=Rhizodiscina lignyota TaxID=1504668 RepID=A0A9P4INX3_9PEZI|nr:NAD(P)-binding protein [Rhizodiscina lignyota]
MAPLPKTMKAVEIDETGGVEVLKYRDVPVPEPKAGQLLVKNDVAGINYIDTYFRSGLYKPPTFPYRLGRESAGTVIALGPSSADANYYGIKEGDHVICLSEATYAQYSAVPAVKTLKIPSGVSSETACAAFLQGLTALTMIRESYAVQKGDWILVHAAAGGTGQWLVRLLHATGAKTIATASTDEKLALAKKLGADVLVNYSNEDVKAKVMEATGGKGVAAVFDGVGKTTFDLSLDCLARKGTLASFGNASGAVPPFAIARLSGKNIKLLRPTLFQYIDTREELEHYVNEMFGLIKEHNWEVPVHKVYPLSEAGTAQEDLTGRKTTGKLLLKP